MERKGVRVKADCRKGFCLKNDFIFVFLDSESIKSQMVESVAFAVAEAMFKFGLFILGYSLAQFWNWAQRGMGKWAHAILNDGNLISVNL